MTLSPREIAVFEATDCKGNSMILVLILGQANSCSYLPTTSALIPVEGLLLDIESVEDILSRISCSSYDPWQY
jgi:hypothetical protein